MWGGALDSSVVLLLYSTSLAIAYNHHTDIYPFQLINIHISLQHQDFLTDLNRADESDAEREARLQAAYLLPSEAEKLLAPKGGSKATLSAEEIAFEGMFTDLSLHCRNLIS